MNKIDEQYNYKKYNGKFISMSCAVEIGWSKPFPVRNQDGVTIIPSEEVVEGTRVLVMVEINHWQVKEKGKDIEGLRYDMLWVRKLVDIEERSMKRRRRREFGEDGGPSLE